MRKFFPVLFLTCTVFWQLGCGGSSADTNQTGTDEQISIVDEAAKVGATPLPEFTDANTALQEGDKLFDANKTEMAVEAYNQAVRLNPDLAEAYFKLGIAYALIEKQQEIEAFNEETTLTPTPTPTRKGKKEQVVRTKDSEKAFEKAVAAYKKILAKNPEDDLSHFNLGRSYNKLDEDKEAEKSLREAVKLKPENSEYQTELGAILIKLAQYDEAVRVLKKALELDAENSEAEELLAKAEAGKKRIDFGVTPKPPPDSLPKSKQSPKPTETETPNDEPKPETKPEPKPEATKPKP
jgi:tetratricopeptide (TPR) repeat protein